MSRTPAAQLARLKVTYPAWTIRPAGPRKGSGYTAVYRDDEHGLRSIYTPSLAGLEAKLAEAGQRH